MSETAPKSLSSRGYPLILTAIVVVADQVTKAFVTSRLPFARPVEVIGDFLRWTYVTNTAVAFSLGRSMPVSVQRVVFFILPLAVLCAILAYYFTAQDLTSKQRWALAAILGGGLGNLVDRIIRSGVVDFIDVKFYGVFGLSRFPTFNLADSTVTIAGLFLVLTFLNTELRMRRKE